MPQPEQRPLDWKSLPPAYHSPAELNWFTPRAQDVLTLAQKEAQRLNHNFVGTEHVLLGLIRLGQSPGFNVLRAMGLNLETLRLEIEKCVGTGPDPKPSIPIRYTPRVKKVLALAVKEARALNHTYVGTEHILLGLLREGDGVAGRVLKNLGVDTEVTRQHVLRELDPNYLVTPDSVAGEPKTPLQKPESNTVDITKRYDVYCSERNQEVVVYRNVLFKGRRSFEHDLLWQFIELEQADGQTVFVSRHSVIKFCEHGVTPGAE